MKILWLSHFIPFPPKGGSLQRSHNLLRQAASKHEVHLVCLNQSAILSDKEAIKRAIEELSTICAEVNFFPISSDRSKWHWTLTAAMNFFSAYPYDVNWFKNKNMYDFLTKLSNHYSFDLIHVDTLGMMPYATVFDDTPIALNHHNIESQMMLRRTEKETNLFKKIYFMREAHKLKIYENKVCNRCKVNLVVSELDGVRLQERVKNVNVSVVDNGVDIDYFKPKMLSGKGEKRLIFAGGMNWYPNREAVLFFLREIWPELLRDDPDRYVTIIGQSPPKELLEAARDTRVFAPGFVDDVRPYFDNASIYICPIFNGGGTRLKILDALAMAKPLIATELAVEGLDLVAEEHYLRAETASDFVTQVNRLERDTILFDKLARSGRQFVEKKYSWNLIGDKLESAYRKAIYASDNKKNI